jgi:hypothetical protein
MSTFCFDQPKYLKEVIENGLNESYIYLLCAEQRVRAFSLSNINRHLRYETPRATYQAKLHDPTIIENGIGEISGVLLFIM